ncbi:AAA family ATPase [Idiomarina sp. Sol25]|uniref:ExeA family protein n=1 Tax=Idiomarina sp. Sol25 TaxID=3064000 RepID=UPI00294B874B|nr:AAA family ATPase [Idiomarina sp. Sol25]MDV6327870.1 AAA family ATPase [Idiomarina sp. Sol25]
MYLYHYGLRELPFTITPNTQFYFDLNSHHEAFEVVLTALKTGEGFIKITGEVGTGKTLLCRRLLNDIPDFFKTAYVPDSYLDPAELRLAIAQELDLETEEMTNQQQLARALQQRLLDINKNGQAVVILIDEAQALPEKSLEALRLLSNLETERRKLVHIVLLGQPELDERLSQKAFRQLRQRISFSHKLTAMNADETAEYIAHRMDVAGYQGTPIFDWKLVRRLHRCSRGVPRLINMLCHKMLLLAYGEGRHQLSTRDLKLAVNDTEDTELTRSVWLPVTVSVCVFFLAAAALSYWQMGGSL